MVLRVGDIVEIRGFKSKYRITNVTKTQITCSVYYRNMEPHLSTHNKEMFTLIGWKPAHVKWY